MRTTNCFIPGLVMFLLLTHYVSEVFALKYSLLIIALLQLISIPVAKMVIKHTGKEELNSDDSEIKFEAQKRELVGEKAV